MSTKVMHVHSIDMHDGGVATIRLSILCMRREPITAEVTQRSGVNVQPAFEPNGRLAEGANQA